MYANDDQTKYEDEITCRINETVALHSVLSVENKNGFVFWRRVYSNDKFYLNAFFEKYLEFYYVSHSKDIIFCC